MIEFTITKQLDMPAEKAWEVFSPFTTLSVPSVSVEVEKEGDPAANGVGAIRRLNGRVLERLESMDPPNSFSYTLLSGAPVKDYLGTVEFKPQDSNTRLTWHVRFNPKLPGIGWLLKIVIRKVIAKMIAELEASVR